MVECPPAIKQSVFSKLQARDLTQSKAFADIGRIFTEMLQREATLVERTASLEKEVAQLKAENESLRRAKNGTFTPQGTAEVDAYSQQVISKLRNDLTESYKRNADNARALFQLTADNKEQGAKIAQKDKEISDLKAKVAEDDAIKKKLEVDIHEKETTVGILRTELQCLQTDYIRLEELSKTLKRENADLVDRWLRKVDEEADKLDKEASKINESTTSLNQSGTETPKAPAPAPKPEVVLKPPSILDANQRPDTLVVKIPSGPRKLLEGHTEDINSLTYNMSGTLLVTGAADKVVRVWDVSSGTSKAVLSGSVQSVMGVSISANDDLVLGCSNDNSTRVWTVRDSRLRHTLTGHTAKVLCGTFADNSQKVVTGSHDRTLKVWDLVKGYCIRTIICFSSCNDLCLGSSGMVISAHLDKSLRFWDVRNGQLEHIIDGLHGNQVTSVCLSPNAKHALSCGRDNVIHMVDVGKFERVMSFRHDDFYCGPVATKACFSPDGQFVASVSINGSIFVWNTASGKIERIIPPRTQNSSGVAVSWNASGHQIATSDKNVCVLWE